MRTLVTGVAVLCGTWSVANTYYDFGSFSVHTHEELWLGRKYAGYPANYLFDGNTRTAWVFNGLLDSPEYKRETTAAGNVFAIGVTLPKESVVDGIRLIGGYVRDRATWKRNNRIKRLRVRAWVGKVDVVLADVTLRDEMAWQAVRFPPERVSEIRIEPVSFYAGRDQDVCISEIELLSGGKPLSLRSNRMALVNLGGGCCCSQRYAVVNRHGMNLMAFDTGEGYPGVAISADGRFVVGGKVRSPRSVEAFVFDSRSERAIFSTILRGVDPQEVAFYFDDWKLMLGYEARSAKRIADLRRLVGQSR